MSKRRVVVFGGGVVVAALGLGVLTWFIAEARRPGWGPAIQASATVLLVGVTSWYAWLTSRLIHVQETAATRSAQRAAVARLLERIPAHELAIGSMGDTVRLWRNLNQPWPEDPEAEDVGQFAIDLSVLAPQLPASLFEETVRTVIEAYRAMNQYLALHTASIREESAALREKREWSREGVEREYASLAKGAGAEWNEAISGGVVQRAERQLNRLRGQAADFLRASPG